MATVAGAIAWTSVLVASATRRVSGYAAARRVVSQPLDVVGGRAGWDLHQVDAAAQQLVFSLLPVAAVGKQRGLAGGDHQRAHRAGEARQPFAPLPAAGQVFGEMRVGAGHQQGLGAVRRQGLPDALHAFTNRVDAGVHGGLSSKGSLILGSPQAANSRGMNRLISAPAWRRRLQ